MLEVRVLGPLEASVDGLAVALGSPNQRRVLAALVAGGGIAGRDRLVDAVWPHDPPPTAVRSLQTYVSRLRGSLGRERITTRSPGWELHADLVDAEEFERLLGHARAASPAEAVGLFDAALATWLGSAYEEFAAEPFALAEARRLEELRAAAGIERAEALLAAGDSAGAVAALEGLVAEEPLYERGWERLVEALAADGRAADALRAAERCRQALGEVGLEPTEGLSRAEGLALDKQRSPVTTTRSPATSGRVPSARSETVGRKFERATIEDALLPGRCVTVVGPGGVGKSRLAVEVAGGVATQRTSFCDLATVERSESVVPVVAAGVGAPAVTAQVDQLVAVCSRGRQVVVLDNCEHVADEVSGIVRRLLDAAPELSILATSREPLRIEGESVATIDPLPITDAIRLFELRAAAAGGGADEWGDIETLCRRLDCLPLAIEMAAGWARSLTAREMLTRLHEEHFPSSPRKDVAPRHRSLEATVAWSYELLPDAERRIFERFSVFAGPVDLDTAVAVVAPAAPAAEAGRLVTNLVDRSLVVAERTDGHTRLRMLETTRAFASLLLRRGDGHRDAAVDHWGWAVRFAEDAAAGLRTPHAARWADRVELLLAELRAAVYRSVEAGDLEPAMRIVAALWFYAYVRLHADVTHWARHIVGRARDTGVDVPPDALACAALGPLQGGDFVTVRAQVKGVPGAAAAVVRADTFLYTGELVRAKEEGEAVVEAARAEGDPVLESLGLMNVALAQGYGGDVDGALTSAAEQRSVATATGCPFVLAWADYVEGEFLAERDPDRARVLFDRSLRRARDARDAIGKGIALLSLTTLHARHGDLSEITGDFVSAVQHWRERHDWAHQVVTLRNLVILLERLGSDEPAAVLLGVVEKHRPAFGADADRLQLVRRHLAERAGERLEVLTNRGRRLDPEEAVALALETLGALGGGVPTGSVGRW